MHNSQSGGPGFVIGVIGSLANACETLPVSSLWGTLWLAALLKPSQLG